LAPEGLLPELPPEVLGLDAEEGALSGDGALVRLGWLSGEGALSRLGALARPGWLSGLGWLAEEGALAPVGAEEFCAKAPSSWLSSQHIPQPKTKNPVR
jgi:hypothetical protein